MSRRVQLTLSLLLLLLLTGCGTTLRQQWYDFTAYYNTFYNTQQFFLEGERENHRNRPEMNPEQIIRIHPAPTGAGTAHFERAIETGAELLRRHSRSGYVDRTLELIGASYFYREEYYSALDTFQDLYDYTSDSTRKQRAAAWMIRTHLELGLHSEAFRIAELEPDSGGVSDPVIAAEVETLLAQHDIESGELQRASERLAGSLPLLENRELKTRGYFLLGQLLERLGDYNGSYLAFQEVAEYRPDYQLEYHARMKEAGLVRRVGNLDMADQLLRSMERDDKYLDRRPDILFEIARTEMVRGETGDAMRLYQQVLRPGGRSPSPVTRAKTYYELAEIYREQFQDLEMAAAYYDSAAMQNPDPSLLPAGWDANERARSFWEFVTLTGEIAELDTLLMLGALPETERESVLSEMIRDREELQTREELESLVDFNRIPAEPEEQISLPGESESPFGFLHIQNEQRLQEEQELFRLQWGNRPLTDHWRRGTTGFTVQDGEEVMGNSYSDLAAPPPASAPSVVPAIDIGSIPVTEAERDSVLHEIYRKRYRLGNIFLLQLNLPDQAVGHFQEVADSEYAPELQPRALYALSEIARQQNRPEDADRWAEQLVSQFPDSDPAQRITGSVHRELDLSNERSPISDHFQSVQSDVDDPYERGEALYQLASENSESDEAPFILYQSILAFIESGRGREGFEEQLNRWYSARSGWEERRDAFFAKQDSAYVKLEDSSLSDEEREYWEEVAESSLPEPDFEEEFPYRGEVWDRVRFLLQELGQLGPGPRIQARAGFLRDELSPPTSSEPF